MVRHIWEEEMNMFFSAICYPCTQHDDLIICKTEVRIVPRRDQHRSILSLRKSGVVQILDT